MTYTIQTNKTAAETRKDIKVTFERWSYVLGRRITYDSNRGDRGSKEAQVEYTIEGRAPVLLRYDKQDSYEKNLRVLYLAIEDVRMADVRGMTELFQAAYLALPAPATLEDPYEVLGVRSDAPTEVIDASYRALAKAAHPDAGGSEAAMTRLNDARARIAATR